jgi:hypothetical protein
MDAAAWATWAQVGILSLTALVLYLYTLETSALRRATVRQTQIALRPVIVPVFEFGREPKFKVKNIGANTAFNIRVKPHELDTQIKWEYRFGSIPVLEPGKDAEIQIEQSIEGEPADLETTRHSFFPRYSTSESELAIEFGDTVGGRYMLKVQIHPRENFINAKENYEIGPVIQKPPAIPTGIRAFCHWLLDWYE